MIKEIAANIWTVEGPELVFAGAPMLTRMTVVRLNNGSLWVHSPVRLDEHGAYPDARLFAEPELKRKIPSLMNADELSDSAPSLYSSDIDQVIFSGNRLFQEAVFFHKSSGTLILTDLMINLRTNGMKLLPRWFLKFEQVVFPNGGVPRLYRWLTSDKIKALSALNTVLGWEPQKIVFCHGEPFAEDASETLKREFGWLRR